MIKRLIIALFFVTSLLGCQWNVSHHAKAVSEEELTIERYDQIEHLFLTTGDFAALQRLKTLYPMETRTLIEDVLCLGQVDEEGINTRFFIYFQDSTLQGILRDVATEYADMNDICRDLSKAFKSLKALIPSIDVPKIYAQIGSLDQSIVVGNGMLGISLDKYLGMDYPLYHKYNFSERQRKLMTRSAIVPDCIGFYLISSYPEADDVVIKWIVNHCVGYSFFPKDSAIERFDSLVRKSKNILQESSL